jgi:hypothetical protein
MVLFRTIRQQPPVGQGLLIIEASWSHSVTPHSVGLLWRSDQAVADNTKHSQEADVRVPSGIPSPQIQQASGLKPCEPWDRHTRCYTDKLRVLISELSAYMNI